MSKRIITISREFGSGGRTVGKELSEKLGIPFYDKELVEKVAEETGFDKAYIEERGEEAPGKTRFAYTFTTIGIPGIMHGMSASDFLWCMQREVILKLADKEPCVIVGRCADFILQEREDTLHAFIYADMDFKKERIVKLYGESEKSPEKRLQEKNKKRAVNYKYYTGQTWGDPQNYDICLSSSKLGLDKCVEILLDLYNKD